MDKKTKTQRVFEKGAGTRLRHSGMSCAVYEVKIDESHLSKLKKQYLSKVFVEAKWLYNHMLSQEDVFTFNTKVKTVTVLNKDKEPEERKLEVISSQMKQSLYVRLKENIINLSKAKVKGGRVGKLDYKSKVCSIPLVQYGITYKLVDENHISVQGVKKPFKVIGINQIPYDAEFSNATLVKRNNDYYIMITCFLPKKKRIKTGKDVGLDFGVKDNITTSDDDTFNINLPTSRQTKRLQRKLRKKIKFSSNWRKQQIKIADSYDETKRKRKDARNKIVSHLVKEYDRVCFQDENIHEWQAGLFGKQVSRSAMGGIISDLKRKSETPIVVDKWFPSTKLCPQCGEKNDIPLSERVYRCVCGYEEKRDLHSARNVLAEGLRMLNSKTGAGTERISWGRDARNACGVPDLCFVAVGQSKLGSMKQEAPLL